MTNEDSLGFAGIGVDDCEAELASFVFEKWGFLKHLLRNHAEARRAEEFPCDLLWEELISDPQYAAQAAMLAKSGERVVIDLGFELVRTGSAGSVIHDRKHIPWMNRAWRKGLKWAENAQCGSPGRHSVMSRLRHARSR